MATLYTTPGVYVEEIPKLPPSIAQVETAIPAFIGYTQTALDNQGTALTLKPTRITSLLEYESMFGAAQPEENMRITYDETQDGAGNTTAETIKIDFSGAASRHNLYYSLRGYFANGGGPCYVVSVAPYKGVGDPLATSFFPDTSTFVVASSRCACAPANAACSTTPASSTSACGTALCAACRARSRIGIASCWPPMENAGARRLIGITT